jgi:hypothetical protein
VFPVVGTRSYHILWYDKAGDGIAVILAAMHEEEEEAEQMISTIAQGPRNICECIHRVHNSRTGHQGVQATWLACKKLFPTSPISYEAVKQVVQDCGKCAKIRDGTIKNHTPTRALPTYHANAVTNVDVLTIVKDKHGYLYAFVFINSFTKYTLIYPTKDKTAKEL